MKSKLLPLLVVVLSTKLFECQNLEPFELDEFLHGAFSSKGFSGVWISGNEFYRQNDVKDVYIFNVDTQGSTLLFEHTVLDGYNQSSFSLSPDKNFVLIRYNPKSIYRHSSVAQYAVYDLTTKKYYQLAKEEHLQYASWSPVGNSIVYVLENNIYYVSTPTDAETPLQITTDGKMDVIYNGIPDWVYEEEVLGSGSAIWWSPDGNHLAFGYFNDEEVPEFSYFIYGDTEEISQYPELITLRYPKVGARNPDFEVKVVSFNDPKNVRSLPVLPSGALSKDHVLFAVTWATNNDVVVVIENRVQNEATIRRCSLSGTTCDIENEFEEPNGWLEIQAPRYNLDGTKYLLVLSQPVDDDSYQHLVLFDAATKASTRLTDGKRVVSGISGWDETRNLIFYTGTGETSPFEQHVYYVNLTNANENVCITCSLNTPEGNCVYATASFSKDFSHLAEICQGPGPNYIVLNSVEEFNSGYVYEDNKDLRDKLSKKALPTIKDVDIDLPSGFTAKARMLLPPGLDESDVTQYPMIVNVYGGPDSNQISDRFSTGFQSYIVTNSRYIYCYIDGRGSGKKGDKMRFQIYRQMGTVEIEDQIFVAKALRDRFFFIDPDRIGIWGWSYGGFATAWALVQDVENVFRFGLSVAPVTDFTLYDTIYTERYMGLPTPEDNEFGYNNTDLSRKVENLRDKSFFLIHGNADDNVHYQQSMLLAKALEHADIMFYQMSYPDENHSLGGVSPHLYHTIDRYWARCFGLPDPQYPEIGEKKCS